MTLAGRRTLNRLQTRSLAGRLIAVLLASLGVAAGLPRSALGQAFQVSPTRIEASVDRGSELPPVRVSNGTDRALVVDIAVAPATQALSGLPTFELSPKSLREGRRLVRVSDTRLRLPPGASRSVGARVVGRPRQGIAVYAVIAFTARDARERQGEDAGVVAPAVRISTNLLLRFPGEPRVRGRITALRAEQGPRRSLRFLARIRNSGNIHTEPRPVLTVATVGGKQVLRRRIPSETVLPGAERELELLVSQRLPAGRYRARVVARIGGSSSTRTANFRLVGMNRLPTPGLRIVSLETPRPDAGDEFTARVRVRSSGTAPVEPSGVASLTRVGGDEQVARRPVRISRLDPGEEGSAEVELPALEEGTYALAVRFTEAGRPVSERSVTFETGTQPALFDRVRDWMAANVGLLLALFGLALFGAIAALLVYVRRLRRATRRSA